MSQNTKDVSMVDITEALNDNQDGSTKTNEKPNESGNITQSLSQMNIDDRNDLAPQLSSRKSTLIFNYDDFDEISKHHEHIEHHNISDDDRIMLDNDEDGDEENDLISTALDGSGSSSSTASSNPNTQSSTERQGSEYSTNSNQRHDDKQAHQSHQQQQYHQSGSQERKPLMVPVEITWQQGGTKVYVTGSFTGWRKMIGLVPMANKPGVFHIKLQLPPGTHRFRFIVDNELRFSDYLPTATDQMGNFVNYLEIVPVEPIPAPSYDSVVQDQEQLQHQQMPQQQHQHQQQYYADDQGHSQQLLQQQARPQVRREPSQSKDGKLSARSQLALHIEEDPDDMGNGYSRFREEEQSKPDFEYTQDIPAVFTDPSVMEQYYLTLDQQQNNQQNMSWLTPPQLPPQLENVILNNYNKNSDSASENNSGALPIPNHVVLNHLATSSIKHNTLCVASIVRYKRKYATQILYAPLQ